jgi:hypothetical protein
VVAAPPVDTSQPNPWANYVTETDAQLMALAILSTASTDPDFPSVAFWVDAELRQNEVTDDGI